RLGDNGGDQSVPRLVVGQQLKLLVRQREVLALKAHHHLVTRLVDVRAVDLRLALTRGEQRRLVQQVAQICAAEARRTPRDLGKVHVVGERLVARVDREDLLAAFGGRKVDGDLPVKATGSQQCR